MKFNFIVLLFFLSFISNAASFSSTDFQPEKPEIKRHAFFIGMGSIYLWNEANINYEFIILQRKKSKTNVFGIQAGFGQYLTLFDGDGKCFNTKLFFLSGKEYRFFEIALGANLFTDYNQYYWMSSYVPNINIGFRRHFQNARGMVRYGIGWQQVCILDLV